MKTPVELTPAAESDLIEIWQYAFELSASSERADSVIDRIEATLSHLASHPRLGSPQSRWGPGVRVFVKDGCYIVYRLVRRTVQVLRITGRDVGSDLIE